MTGTVEIADVRNLDFDELAHFCSLLGAQTDIGFGLDGSSLYLTSAAATLSRSILPSSASALRAARVTQRRSTSKKWRSFSRVSERPKPSVPSVT
jgi:hypothetical protein